MDSSPEFFRNAVKEFKAGDALLSSQLKSAEDMASAKRIEVLQKSDQADQAALDYMEAVEKKETPSKNHPSDTLTSQIDSNLARLKNLTGEVKSRSDDLEEVNKRIENLNAELLAALAQERLTRRARTINYVLAGIILIAAIVTLHLWLASKTSLSFVFSVDGKDLPATLTPNVLIDGKSFVAGNNIALGRHEISVTFHGGETFIKKVWVLYGKNDLGILPLETSKGSLSITVKPSAATVTVKQGDKIINQGEAPFKIQRLPVGAYDILVRRSDYEETRSITITRQQETETNIDLNLGGAQLFSEPADADYDLSDNLRQRRGSLPAKIDDIPVGNYSLKVTRKGWPQTSSISIRRGNITTNKTEFPYGSLELTSDPTGLTVSTNSLEIGKTPIVLTELQPGSYSMIVSDGENDLTTNIDVTPKGLTKHTFTFRYGTVQLSSLPMGATVIRKGKEIGKTPLTLNHVLAGDTMINLQLLDYVTTNFTIRAKEGASTDLLVTLISERYLAKLADARRAASFSPPDYGHALESINEALQISSEDNQVVQLRDDYAIRLKVGDATKSFETNGYENALSKINAVLVLQPADVEALELKQKITTALTAQMDERADKRAEAAGREFDQVIAGVTAHCGTATTAATQTKVWRTYATTFQANDILLRSIARSGQWKLKTETHPAGDVTVTYFTPPGTLLWDKSLEDNQLNFVVQICQLPNEALDIRAKMITGLMASTDPAGYQAKREQKQNERFQTFESDYDRELKAFLIKPKKLATLSDVDFKSIAVLDPPSIIKDCWSVADKSKEGFSKLATVDAAHSNVAAVPVAAASDVIVKGIEAISFPFHKKQPRFNQEHFVSGYENYVYRYYGTIASRDVNNKTLTFSPSDTSKEGYAVIARLRDATATNAPTQIGSPVWVTGQLTALEEATPPFPAANRLILDNSMIYPSDIISTNK